MTNRRKRFGVMCALLAMLVEVLALAGLGSSRERHKRPEHKIHPSFQGPKTGASHLARNLFEGATLKDRTTKE